MTFETGPAPKPASVEKPVSELPSGSIVIRDGVRCEITKRTRLSDGEWSVEFSNGDRATLDSKDTLDVPA